MEKSKKIGTQIYGYTICLVTVITFLISTTAFVSAVMNMSDPLHSGYTPAGSPSMASFENYKMDMLRTTQKADESNKANYVPDDQTMRTMYEAARSYKIQSVNHESKSTMIVSGLIIFICIILFITHWRWMKIIGRADTA